jgi:hypothetical protein
MIRLKDGAQEKTRTSTTLRSQVPETCASTNSATRALHRHLHIKRRQQDQTMAAHGVAPRGDVPKGAAGVNWRDGRRRITT